MFHGPYYNIDELCENFTTTCRIEISTLLLDLFSQGNWILRRDVTGHTEDLVTDADPDKGSTALATESGYERSKREADLTDMVAVPWQTLWLLQSTNINCGFQEVIMRLGNLPTELQV